MLSYGWSGNVLELENCMKYLTCLDLQRPIDPYDLPVLAEEADDSVCIAELARSGPLKQVKQQLVEQFERTYLEEALRRPPRQHRSCRAGQRQTAPRITLS
jgi:DNA-binding NtrC family response regulator